MFLMPGIMLHHRGTCDVQHFGSSDRVLHHNLASCKILLMDAQVDSLQGCGTCEGSGTKPGTSASTCSQCGGQGQVMSQMRTPLGVFQQVPRHTHPVRPQTLAEHASFSICPHLAHCLRMRALVYYLLFSPGLT